MTVSSLGNDKLKISLDAREIKRLFGSYEKIDCNNPNTKFALNLLLKQAVPESDFKLNSQKVNVEIIKNITGGCDIYFLKNNLFFKKRVITDGSKQTYIMEFSCLEDAIKASKLIETGPIPSKIKSCFFRFKTNYRLIISSENELSKALYCANEFAEKFFYTNTEKAKTEEYGKELISENAISLLSSL